MIKILALIVALTIGIPVPGMVWETDAETVTVETYSGNLYAFYGDGYMVGEKIVLLMRDGRVEGVLE